jgi:hypothetical protein
VEHGTLEAFSTWDSGPFPFAVLEGSRSALTTFRYMETLRVVDSLENAARVNQDMALILNDILRVVSSLNLDVPLLVVLIPFRANYFMT